LIEAQYVAVIDAVYLALCSHLNSEEVQESGCCALFRLTQKNAERGSYAVNAGAVERVVATLRTHTEDKLMRVAACMVLKCLTELIEGDTVRTVHADAVEAVAELLSRTVVVLPRGKGAAGMETLNIFKSACRMLGGMLTYNNAEEVQGWAGSVGTIEALRAVLLKAKGSNKLEAHDTH
jgi:hypothetical protein